MAGDERLREAVDSTRDTAKQLITLASSILTVTVTFHRDLSPQAGENPNDVLLVAWVVYAISIGFGVLTLLGLTHELAQSRHDPSLSTWSVRWPPWVQGISFLLATTLIVWFGGRTLR